MELQSPVFGGFGTFSVPWALECPAGEELLMPDKLDDVVLELWGRQSPKPYLDPK